MPYTMDTSTMPKLSSNELRAWYKNFSKALYEKAHIDVTRVEDLGRVKNFEILEWLEDQPSGAESEAYYAYVPRTGLEDRPALVNGEFVNIDGRGYANPAPSKGDFEAYSKWLMENLDPEVSDDQIQALMNMSKAGTLMVFGPGGGTNNMQQVWTDDDGNIRVSLPRDAYDDRTNESLPPEQQLPHEPLFPVDAITAVRRANANLPQVPEPPASVSGEPGFWSWLGYVLGLDTVYARLVQYEKDKAAYEKAREDYKDKKDEWVERLKNSPEYQRAQERIEQYRQELADFKSNPMGVFYAIQNGYQAYQTSLSMNDHIGYDARDFQIQEQEFLSQQHAKLPQGKLAAFGKKLEEKLYWDERTRLGMHNLLGNGANLDKLMDWFYQGVFSPSEYQLKDYALPIEQELRGVDKALAQSTLESPQWKEQENRWKELADAAGLAALGEITAGGGTYHRILRSLVTECRPNSGEYLAALEPAREMARQSLETYYNGDSETLAKMLAGSLRRGCQEAAEQTEPLSAGSMNNLYLMSRVMKILDEDPKMMAQTGLQEQEIREIRANLALRQVLQKGLQAQKDIVDHALYRKELGAEALQQAGRDAIFAQTIAGSLRNAQSREAAVELKQALLSDKWVSSSLQQLEEKCDLSRMSSMTREEMGLAFEKEGQAAIAFRREEQPVAKGPKEEQPRRDSVLEEAGAKEAAAGKVI